MLACLLLRPGEVVSTDRLLDELWGERPPPTARNSLQNAVSQLRRRLGGDVVETRPPGYVLAVDPEQVDLHRFRRLVHEAWEAPPAERGAKLEEALALWRGPPLADVAFEPFAELECARLEELRLAAEEDLLDAELALGRHATLVPRLEALIVENPLREGLRAQLMLALYRSGRQADGLQAYRDARATLVDELGIEPGPALRELEAAILRHDPSLAPERVRVDADDLAPEHRRPATVVAFDIVAGNGGRGELDPEVLAEATRPVLETIRAAAERHGGTVRRSVGEELVAFFGLPVAREDDGLRAVRAADEVRRALPRLGDGRGGGVEVAVAAAVATGVVLVRGDRAPTASGEVVNLALRLAHAARPGEVLLAPTTVRLARHAAVTERSEPLHVHGAERLAVVRLVGVAGAAPAITRRLGAPLVGRRQELRALLHAFARARDGRRCVLATVLGDAGIGKSRLAAEVLASVGDGATVLIGCCVSYGEGATFLPIREVVAQAAGEASEEAVEALLTGEADAAAVARRLAELLDGADSAGSTADAFWAFRRLLETLGARSPVVLALDDVHWAEPTLLDLVAHVAEHAAAPLLLLCLARPELLDARPAWADGACRLEPLEGEEGRLLGDAVGGALPAEARARLVELAGGNPLYAEQLAAYAVEEGVAALGAVPPSLAALLASRVDRLPPAERAVLERAAVFGRDFSHPGAAHLAPPGAALATESVLRELETRGLVRAAGGGAYRFHHVLLRDAVYDAVPKARRSELHERAADWLEGQEQAVDEVVGFHLEQAYRLRAEVGTVDGHARRLAHEAGERLGRAGLRAFMRGDITAAVNLLRRAVGLLPERDAQRRELLCELGVALNAAAEPAAAIDALEEAATASDAEGDRRLASRARIELAALRMNVHAGRPADVVALAERAIPLFEALDDQRSLARAWFWKGVVHGSFSCQNGPWEEAARRALLHYSRTRWSTATCRGQIAAALFFGPRPVREALESCAQLLREAGGERVAEAEILASMSGLEAFAGGLDEARTLLDRSVTLYRELGRTLVLATTCGPMRGRIEMLAGDFAAAEAHFREACETCVRLHMWAYLATTGAYLAHALGAQGRLDEADHWSAVAQRHASEGDISAQFSWRSVRALVLARQGDVAGAEGLARDAVEILAPTDALNQHAQAVLDLAEVLRLAARPGEARQAADDAARLFERKGNVVSARVAQQLARELQPA